MAKLTLSDLANLQNETSAVTAINNNNTAIETALENTLSRDGTSPNTMTANLDMNSKRIVNLADGITDQEPFTVGQAAELVLASASTVGITDGDKGDIVVSGGGLAWAIDTDSVDTNEIVDNAVTNLKLANMVTQTIKGRTTAGTGDPQDLTAAQVLTILSALSNVTVQVFTGSGTYTPTTGMKKCLVISTGAGGGGGGADCSDTAAASAAGGGAAGATAISLLAAADVGASKAVTIGAAGAAGAATGANGGTGGSTIFGAVIHTAAGGAGGFGSLTATDNWAEGSDGGVATGGVDLGIIGGNGSTGKLFYFPTLPQNWPVGGDGGASFWGGGGQGVSSGNGTASAGTVGKAYGSGGAGAASMNTVTGAAGGAGKAGVCFVLEFI